MSIKFKPYTKLSENDKFVIQWMNNHKMVGYLFSKRHETSTFYVRMTGMLSYFICKINYGEVKDLLPYLEHLNEALKERVEQEERAKQCGILLRRLHKLRLKNKNNTHVLSIEAFSPIPGIEELPEEEKKIYDEYYRIYPEEATTYEEKYTRYFPRHFHYWDNYIRLIKYRFVSFEYIPVYEDNM